WLRFSNRFHFRFAVFVRAISPYFSCKMSNEQAIYDALRDIDKGHSEHKRQFEDWVNENKGLIGTSQYRTYVKNFQEWEKDVLDKKQGLIAQLPSAAADLSLSTSLERVKPMEFLMAMMTMSVKDQSFLKAMLTAHKQVTQSNDMKQSVLANAQPIHGPAYNPNVPPPSFRSVVNNASPYGYAGRAELTAKTEWTNEPAVKRVFRPPSPIAEYKSTPLPFRDFSQT
ncbi:hypothetical protein PENTCL1PPCAC_2304, partial [Pristionchus entomophagus]